MAFLSGFRQASRDIHSLGVKGFEDNGAIAIKAEEDRCRKILKAPFSELFVFKAGVNSAGQGVFDNKANTDIDFINKFQGCF
jgi:predicted helicase